jgi:hypothetical protein
VSSGRLLLTAYSDYDVRQDSTAQDEIMQKLFVKDMTAEIESLQNRKDHLLLDSYKWILDNKDYQNFTDWHHGNTKRLLWIKGDAGKGKTMLLIGIIQELTGQLETHFDKPYLSYFFCQGTDASLNTATAVLRGLIWMLLRQEKSLIRHLDIFKDSGSKLLEDRNVFYNLKKILQNMLEDTVARRVYLIVDALDECRNEEPGLPQLLQLISEVSETHDKAKWLVSSRNLRDIETILEENKTRTRLSLELNAKSVAGAVDAYIDYKMAGLTERYRKAYAARKDPGIHERLRKIQDDVVKELCQKAEGTFLWVALVFEQIGRAACGADKILELVRKTPPGLDKIYDQMMGQIDKLTDGYSEHCKRALSTANISYRPLQLSELAALAELPELAPHHDIVRLCGLLAIREEDDIVYFVHQSAKDFFSTSKGLNILLKDQAEEHRRITHRSLELMRNTLKRDICSLRSPGSLLSEVKSVIDQGVFANVRYACSYWADHLRNVDDLRLDQIGLCDGGEVHTFLQDHFLHWLEALSLMGNVSNEAIVIRTLESMLLVSG